MSDRIRWPSWSAIRTRRPITRRARLLLIAAPFAICALIVARVYFSLVGYYLERTDWTARNFLARTAYTVGAAYDAAVISVNALRIVFDRREIAATSALATVRLRLEPSSLDKMVSAPRGEKTSRYHRARLLYPDGTWRNIQYRLRGRNIWHWQARKPSLRLKLGKRWPLGRQRHINLINPEDRPMIGNYQGDRLAEKMGILTHATRFVRVFINGEYRGVYHWTTREDESLLIRKKRMKGLFFIGDSLGETWAPSQFKIAGDRELLKKLNPMTMLVDALHAERSAPKYDALWKILAKEKYAAWVAVHHLASSIHTDFNHNNLFYFDPALGRIEPLPSDMMGHGAQLYPLYKYRIWRDFAPDHTVPLNERIYPLMDVALRDPTFYHLRNKLLYDAMADFGSARRQRGELEKIFARIDADVHADRDKTALQNTFVGDYPIPYSNAQYDASKADLFAWLDKRQDFLRRELDRVRVSISLGRPSRAGRIFFMVEVDGHAAARFATAKLRGRLFADFALDGTASHRIASIGGGMTLYPGVRDYVGADWNLHTFGNQRHLIPGSQRYLFAAEGVTADALGAGLAEAFRNALSGRRIDVAVKRIDELPSRSQAAAGAGIHAWRLQSPATETVVLGPGVVELATSIETAPGQEIVVEPGTTLRLARDVSIVARGKLTIAGTRDAVVRIERLDSRAAWGGLAVLGRRASGSRISHAVIEGGSMPSDPLVTYSGMISAHGGGDLKITHSRFAGNVISDDLLHVVYGRVTLENVAFARCFADCVDLDYATGRISDLTVARAGNDGIDFMGSDVALTRIEIAGAGDKGLSVGENSRVDISAALIVDSNIAIAVKDASVAQLDGAILRGNAVALDLYRKHLLYGSPGELTVSATSFEGNEVNLRTERGATVTFVGQPVAAKTTGGGTVSHRPRPGN